MSTTITRTIKPQPVYLMMTWKKSISETAHENIRECVECPDQDTAERLLRYLDRVGFRTRMQIVLSIPKNSKADFLKWSEVSYMWKRMISVKKKA
jgi:hypothetical protein